MEAQSQSLTALNNFYYDTRRGMFDPRSYTQVENRIMAIQAGSLPFIGHGGISEQHVGQGHVGGGAAQTMMSSQFQLPALDNLRTKTELLAVDRIMEQAQATIYERPAQMAAAGVAQVIQPEAYHIRSENNKKYHMRVQSEAPKTHILQHQPMHYAQSASIATSSNSYAAESPPALTPTNSTQSYPSSSPVSPRSNLSISPVATHSTPAVYPSLSSSTSSSANSESAGIYNLGISNGGNMAPGTTLGGQFPGDAHHRYGGGHLHRARPLQVRGGEIAQDNASTPKEKAMDEDMESSDDSTTMAMSRRSTSLSKESPTHPSIFTSKILNTSETSSASSPETSPEASPSSPTSEHSTHDPVWLGIVRTLEDLRDWIRQRLDNGEFEEGDDIGQVEGKIKQEFAEEKIRISEIGAESGAVYPILAEVRG